MLALQLRIDFLTQTDTNKAVIKHVRSVTIGVKSHAFIQRIIGRCTEIRRSHIVAPISTLLVTITCVTGNEETSVERIITDQQLVGVRGACSKTFPQSIGSCTVPIVLSGRYGLVGFSLNKVSLASSLVIHEDYFRELKEQQRTT